MRLPIDTASVRFTAAGPDAVLNCDACSLNPDRRDLIHPVERATISLAEAALILGIHRSTAWSLHRRGEFPVPVLKIGSTLRVVKVHLQEFLETGDPIGSDSRVCASTSSAG